MRGAGSVWFPFILNSGIKNALCLGVLGLNSYRAGVSTAATLQRANIVCDNHRGRLLLSLGTAKIMLLAAMVQAYGKKHAVFASSVRAAHALRCTGARS